MESGQPTKGFFHRMTDIVMPKSKYVAEHKRLLTALKTQDPALLSKEFREQSQEVKKVLKGGGHHICQCIKKGKPLGSCGGSFTDSVPVRVAPK